MRFLFDNIDFNSNSGPNSFGRKLALSLIKRGHSINTEDDVDVQISFIQATQKIAPLIQRLDGIYFNSDQDWKKLNEPIKKTYDIADGVVYQSNFNKMLSEKYFGLKEVSTVIHNGTDLNAIELIEPLKNQIIDNFENVWCCASSWRPHKRLAENIRYFREHAAENDCLVIAGDNADFETNHDRIFFCGSLPWDQLIVLYKRSKYFLHLALMDHCPNVVIDARAAGCHIICASSGGTSEISGLDSTIVQDMEWDYLPFKLYEPPALDFSLTSPGNIESNLDINYCAEQYIQFTESLVL